MPQTALSDVPAKVPRIAVYIEPEIKERLEKLALAERRSLSQMAAILIEQGLDRVKVEKNPRLNDPE